MSNKNTLTKKERIFCEEFLRTGEKEKSAKTAGYPIKKLKENAEKLLAQERIIEYLLGLQKRRLKELAINNNWAVLRAVEVYNQCMKATPVTKWDSKERCMIETGEYTVDYKEALKALEMIKGFLENDTEVQDCPQTAVAFIDDLSLKN